MLGEADRYGVQAPGCFSTNDTTAEADLLDKCAANLMRMWCDD